MDICIYNVLHKIAAEGFNPDGGASDQGESPDMDSWLDLQSNSEAAPAGTPVANQPATGQRSSESATSGTTTSTTAPIGSQGTTKPKQEPKPAATEQSTNTNPPATKEKSIWDSIGDWSKANPGLAIALGYGLPVFLGTHLLGSLFGQRNSLGWATLFGLGSGLYGYNKKHIDSWFDKNIG